MSNNSMILLDLNRPPKQSDPEHAEFENDALRENGCILRALSDANLFASDSDDEAECIKSPVALFDINHSFRINRQ